MDLVPETGNPAASNRPEPSAAAWKRWLYEVIFESDTPAGKGASRRKVMVFVFAMLALVTVMGTLM